MHLISYLWDVFLNWTGTANTAGKPYGFWSGFGSDLGEFTLIGIAWRHLNCHAAGCKRIGVHKVSGTHYVTCRKHHPDHDGGKKHTAAQIAVKARQAPR